MANESAETAHEIAAEIRKSGGEWVHVGDNLSPWAVALPTSEPELLAVVEELLSCPEHHWFLRTDVRCIVTARMTGDVDIGYLLDTDNQIGPTLSLIHI